MARQCRQTGVHPATRWPILEGGHRHHARHVTSLEEAGSTVHGDRAMVRLGKLVQRQIGVWDVVERVVLAGPLTGDERG